MKDAAHHVRHIQKKIIRETRKQNQNNNHVVNSFSNGLSLNGFEQRRPLRRII